MDEIKEAFVKAGLLSKTEAEELDRATGSRAKPQAGDEPADDGITKAFRDAGLL